MSSLDTLIDQVAFYGDKMNADDNLVNLLRMGWYLDTALFMDFIQRNIRTGFDRAEAYDGQTIARIKGVPKSRKLMIVPILSGGTRFQFELTSPVNYLRILHYTEGTRYFYSELTKAEVFRSLARDYPNRTPNEIVNWWNAFESLLGDYQRAEIDFPIDDQISNLALNYPINKNAQDYIHLLIAKKKGLAFITSDKLNNQIERLRTEYYQQIYSWSDLKANLPIDERMRL